MNEEVANILLVEDDQNLGFLLSKYIELHDFKVFWFKTAEAALEFLEKCQVDLCILDVNLPGQDGFDLAKNIKKQFPFLPFIFLTARNLKVDKLLGFKIGGDDYITKPVDEEELIARIRAVLNRKHRQLPAQNSPADHFKISTYRFDYTNQQLIFGSIVQKLTVKESELLRLLCLSQGKILSRKETLQKLWGQVDYFSRKSMDVYISRLRGYLKEDPKVKIENVHGKGFILIQ